MGLLDALLEGQLVLDVVHLALHRLGHSVQPATHGEGCVYGRRAAGDGDGSTTRQSWSPGPLYLPPPVENGRAREPVSRETVSVLVLANLVMIIVRVPGAGHWMGK